MTQSAIFKPNEQTIEADRNGVQAHGDLMFSGADLVLYGAAVSQFGRGLPDRVLEALSWVFLNRRMAGRSLDPLLRPELTAVEWVSAHLNAPVSQEDTRAISVFARVIAGGVPDPVTGAIRFHHHHEMPAWTAKMELHAIIGPYLFYGPRLRS